MTFDPTSVDVTCVTLPKDHCVQVPWEYINVCGYSDQFCKLEQFSGFAVCGFRGLWNMLFLMEGGIRNRLAAVCMDLLWLGGVCPEPWRSIWYNDMIGPYFWKMNNFNPPLLQE